MFPETVEFDENVAFDVNFNVNSTIDIDTWAVPDPSDPNCGDTCPAICTDLVLNRSRIAIRPGSQTTPPVRWSTILTTSRLSIRVEVAVDDEGRTSTFGSNAMVTSTFSSRIVSNRASDRLLECQVDFDEMT